MVTVLECGQLSAHAYHPLWAKVAGLRAPKVSMLSLRKVKGNGWYHITNVDRHMSPHHPFYAALYMKFRDRKPIAAVVAIRGYGNEYTW